MIIRLSAKLAAKLRVAPARVLPLDANPFADWSAHLFTAERTQFLIVTNTASLYSVLLYGRGISNDSHFIERALSTMREYMQDDEQSAIYRRFIAPASDVVQFSKALNRSVTGSMNDMISIAKMWLTEGELSPDDTAFKINDMPMSMLKYKKPRVSFQALRQD